MLPPGRLGARNGISRMLSLYEPMPIFVTGAGHALFRIFWRRDWRRASRNHCRSACRACRR